MADFTAIPRPHAVTQISGGAWGTITFSFDANGNLIQCVESGGTRTESYTSFNMLSLTSKTGATNTLQFLYGAEHQRVKEIRTVGSTVTTTHYVHPDNQGGLLYEMEVSGAVTKHKHYINAAGGVIALHITGTATSTEYWHKDNLGSVAVITDAAGTVTTRRQYDPWGKVTGSSADGYRGYTGHEHFDSLGIIHMNGRTYIPGMGRFMSADPFIQDADNMQDYNRYGYCMNNPVICTDPSGYFSFKGLFKAAAAVAVAYFTYGAVSSAFAIQGTVYIGTTAVGTLTIPTLTGAILGGAAGGFAGSFVGSGGNFEAGLKGALSGALFGAAGFAGDPWSAERFLAHAGAGCVQGELGGGGCGRGAASAVVGKLASNLWGDPPGQGSVGGFVATVVAGGTVSVIGGGKFANGATTAAFGYLFNQVATSKLDTGSGPGHYYRAAYDVCDMGESSSCNFSRAVGGTQFVPGPGAVQTQGLSKDGNIVWVGGGWVRAYPTETGVLNVTTPVHIYHQGWVLQNVFEEGTKIRIEYIGYGKNFTNFIRDSNNYVIEAGLWQRNAERIRSFVLNPRWNPPKQCSLFSC